MNARGRKGAKEHARKKKENKRGEQKGKHKRDHLHMTLSDSVKSLGRYAWMKADRMREASSLPKSRPFDTHTRARAHTHAHTQKNKHTQR